VVLQDLDPEGARALAARLTSYGLEARAVEPRDREARRKVRRLFVKKDALMAGRILGVIAGSSGGAFSGLGRTLSRGEAAIPLLLILALGIVAVPVATVIRHRMPEVRWRAGGQRRALKRYLEIAPGIRSPALASLARRVVLRLRELGELSSRDGKTADATAAVEELVLRAADWIEACQLLEDRLGDEGGLYREVADLRRRQGKARNDREIAEAERSIDTRRSLERSREVLLDRLLEFSARLDSLWVTMGSLGVHAAAEDLRELERAAEETSLAVAAVREVEEGPA
jgi:hypothetical protein